MTHVVDLYYTMRSPYCYLATAGCTKLADTYDLHFNLKPIYPLALTQPDFFEKTNPMWVSYVVRDTRRIAERLGIPFRFPKPDPIVQDMETRRIAPDQPHIRRLTRMAQLAAEQDKGLPYVASVSGLIYSPDGEGWNEGDRLEKAVGAAGLDGAALLKAADAEADRLDAAIAQNREDQLAAGHWGAPLFVYAGEPFFGQDRMDDVVWRMQQDGLKTR